MLRKEDYGVIEDLAGRCSDDFSAKVGQVRREAMEKCGDNVHVGNSVAVGICAELTSKVILNIVRSSRDMSLDEVYEIHQRITPFMIEKIGEAFGMIDGVDANILIVKKDE